MFLYWIYRFMSAIIYLFILFASVSCMISYCVVSSDVFSFSPSQKCFIFSRVISRDFTFGFTEYFLILSDAKNIFILLHVKMLCC